MMIAVTRTITAIYISSGKDDEVGVLLTMEVITGYEALCCVCVEVAITLVCGELSFISQFLLRYSIN